MRILASRRRHQLALCGGHIIEVLETPKAHGTNPRRKRRGGPAQGEVTTRGMLQWAISSEASVGRPRPTRNVQRLGGDGLPARGA
jgi:hypothetical protein